MSNRKWGDSVLVYLELALPLAEKLGAKEMTGTVLNNLGSAHKMLKNWPQAEGYLRQSVQYNQELLGDSAAVLAHTYFHLGAVMLAKAEVDSMNYLVAKSRAIAEKHGLAELLHQIRAYVGVHKRD